MNWILIAAPIVGTVMIMTTLYVLRRVIPAKHVSDLQRLHVVGRK